MTFRTTVEPFESTTLLNLKIKGKNKLSSPFSLPLLTGEVQNIFKRLYLWVNFLNDLAMGKAVKASLASLVAPLSRMNKSQT